jgi:hypothetical protein
MHALALAHHHGWAQKFDKYLPPVTMEEALAAHKEAQDADEDHKIVTPSLTHTTGSGRTSWQIAEDGAVTATICEITPSEDGDWGEYTLTERAVLTVASDGAHTLTQLEGCDIDDLGRACRVWRAVQNVILRPAIDENTAIQDDEPNENVVQRINRPQDDDVMIVVNR